MPCLLNPLRKNNNNFQGVNDMSWTTEKMKKYAAKRQMSIPAYQRWLDEQLSNLTDFDKETEPDVAEYTAAIYGAMEVTAQEMNEMEISEEAHSE